MPATEFQAFCAALARAGALGEPAELHGQLCGLACSLGVSAGSPWVSEVLEDCDIAPERRDAVAGELTAFAGTTTEAMNRGDMSLRLALPDDEASMDERAAGLAFWCQGFMHGLSQSALSPERMKSGLLAEIIQDFLEISHAELGQGETLAEAEEAYAELVEFVRVSVQLVYEELQAERARHGGPTH